MNTDREKLKASLDILTLRYNGEMRGRMVPTPKALRLMNDIKALNAEIKRIDREAAERLALEKAPIDDVLEVIAIPLLADVMNDLIAGVDGMLRRAGVQETVFGECARQIRRAALAMIDTLDHSGTNIPRLLEADDTLVDALKKKLMSYIRQHLNIKKRQ